MAVASFASKNATNWCKSGHMPDQETCCQISTSINIIEVNLLGTEVRKIFSRLMLSKQEWQVSKRGGRWGAECSVMGRKHACPATEPTQRTTSIYHTTLHSAHTYICILYHNVVLSSQPQCQYNSTHKVLLVLHPLLLHHDQR